MDRDVDGRISALCDVYAAQGVLTDPAWRAALGEVPRHWFVPARARVVRGGGPGHAIDRDRDPAAWWDAVYSDAVTPSCGSPRAVLHALHALAPRDHDRVLEAGTGAGWTAALLSWRVGGANVTSVEADELVAARAAADLAEAGHGPHLFVGDEAAGFPDNAPYDRVHVTRGVTAIARAWLEQTRPGGVIVCPWTPAYGGGHLACLTVDGQGRAIGRFPHLSGDTMERARPASPSLAQYVGGTEHETERGTTLLDPRSVAWDSYGADLAIGALVPRARKHVCAARGDSGELTLWLLETGAPGGSWASVDYEPGADRFAVEQYGGRRLWDEVSRAYLRWVAWGRPGRERFGLTARPDGHDLWLDTPGNVLGGDVPGGG
ncbi:protein-L-isoaspartate(D-aspartate) O-methyltransferase [Actinomadura graeca]|uniref:protein-L-isoaspartate(D-aspartate) O-methyltransferase n=1 Tax=Actinomadura graeca TaxID=2750812 RepID=UPI001E5FD2EC|nr:protein-L-isoaspartate(D-aspartate) O-methyltransferase [Actinomadura graeca]